MYRVQGKGSKTAEVYIYEDVGEGWFGGVGAKRFADDLKAVGEVSQIDVRINSYGGDVFDGFAIYRQLVDHPARVTTYVDGVAASIASVIAMAGDEIVVSEAGFVMIHNAWTMAFGDGAEMRKTADRLDAVTEQIAGVYIKRTGKTKDRVAAWMNDETWFNSAEAVEHGFATRVVENLQIAAKAEPTRLKFQRRPAQLEAGARPDFDRLRSQVSVWAERLAVQQRAAHHRTRGAG